MKFLCLECDEVMAYAERQIPGDGTLAVVFGCPACGREMALLTNPMETRMVSSMGVKIGGREVPEQPLETVRSTLEGGRDEAFVEPAPTGPASSTTAPTAPAAATPRPEWSPEALERLEKVPGFVRGMVKRIYTDFARERTIARITPEVMDRARSELGLEGM